MSWLKPSLTPPPVSEAARELFGGQLRYDEGWSEHELVHLRVTFWTQARQLPRTVARSARSAWVVDRVALLAVAAAQLLNGLATAVGLLATNTVLTYLLSGGTVPERLRTAVPAIAVVAAAGALGSLARAVSTWAGGRLEPRIERHAMTRLLRRAVRVRLETFEEDGFHRLLRSGRYGAEASRRMLQYSISTVQSLVGLVAAGGVLAVLHPLLFPLLLVIVAPKGWASVRSARQRYLSMQVWLEHARQQDLLESLLTTQEPAAEIRAHAAGPYLLDRYQELAAASAREQARLARAEARAMVTGDAASGLATALTYAALAGLLVLGAVPLAAASTAVLAIRTGTAELQQLVQAVNQLYEQALFVRDLEDACTRGDTQLIPAGGCPVPERPAVISAKGVSFSYPGASTPALKGVDVRIEAGRIIALVGANGSGKTTLAKILAGLYEPTDGVVTWDRIPTSELDRDQLFGRVSYVCQDYPRWPFTAETNVAIGRPDVAVGARDHDRLERAARDGAADGVVAGLVHGWQTLLARGFAGGVDLSGGQWQRLALARAWYRDAPLLICDEPTAALDPAAEIEAFEHIRARAAAGQTVILITHRLASVRHADRIYLLEDGSVAEHGTHAELVAAGSGYARLFARQAAQYGET